MVCRRKIVNRIELFDLNIIIITPGEYASRFEMHRNSLGDAANSPNTPNGSGICTFYYFDLVAFWRHLYSLQDILVFCSTTSGVFRSTGEAVSEHLGAHRFAFNLCGSTWEHLEGSVWLFRVAELFGYDFQTILHFADAYSSRGLWVERQQWLHHIELLVLSPLFSSGSTLHSMIITDVTILPANQFSMMIAQAYSWIEDSPKDCIMTIELNWQLLRGSIVGQARNALVM